MIPSSPSSGFGEELYCERENVSNVDVVSLLLSFFWKFPHNKEGPPCPSFCLTFFVLCIANSRKTGT